MPPPDPPRPIDVVDQNTIELRQIEERIQARLQAQAEWRRSNTLLCDCPSCIKLRDPINKLSWELNYPT